MPTISVLMPCHNCAPTLPAALDSLLGQSFCDFEILAVNNPHHPEIILLGAGRESRKRAAWLKQEGIRVTAYADISPGKIGQKISGRRVLPVHELPPPGQCFCLSYVEQRGMGSRVCASLQDQGYVLGRDFLLAA
ncbi:MAG: glycosyltransferase [Desulfovermiculus sp.]